jgi:hypothetical protein
MITDALAEQLTHGSFKPIPACEETTDTQRIEEDSWLPAEDSNSELQLRIKPCPHPR